MPNYLISSILWLLVAFLFSLQFSSRTPFDIAPSLALSLTFITFLASISQQYWMRLKMNRFHKRLAELGLSFFSTPFFRRSIAYVVFFQLFVAVSLYYLSPSILSLLDLDGYDYFRLCIYHSLSCFSSASIPFSLLFKINWFDYAPVFVS